MVELLWGVVLQVRRQGAIVPHQHLQGLQQVSAAPVRAQFIDQGIAEDERAHAVLLGQANPAGEGGQFNGEH